MCPGYITLFCIFETFLEILIGKFLLIFLRRHSAKKFFEFFLLNSRNYQLHKKIEAAIHNTDHLPILRILSFPVCHRDAAGGEMTTCPPPSPHHRVRVLLISPAFRSAGPAHGFDGACEGRADLILLAYPGHSAFRPPYISGHIIRERLVK